MRFTPGKTVATGGDVRSCYQQPKYGVAWHAFWGETRDNVLYPTLSLSRSERQTSELEQLLSAMIAQSRQDAGELPPLAAGLAVMLFSVWIESHLHPEPRNCEIYRRSLRLFRARSFPDYAVPLTPPG